MQHETRWQKQSYGVLEKTVSARMIVVSVCVAAIGIFGWFKYTKYPPEYARTNWTIESHLSELELLRGELEADISVWRLLSTIDGGIRAIGANSNVDVILDTDRSAFYAVMMEKAQVSTVSRIGEDFEFTIGNVTKLNRLFVIGVLNSDRSESVLAQRCRDIRVVDIPTGQCVNHVHGNWYAAYRWSSQ